MTKQDFKLFEKNEIFLQMIINPQNNEFETFLTNQIKTSISRNTINNEIDSTKEIVNDFSSLDTFIESQKSNQSTQLEYNDIILLLDNITQKLENLPNNINFHGVQYFQTLFIFYTNIPDSESNIKLKILSIIDILICNSSDAKNDIIECDFIEFSNLILSECQSSAIKLKLFYLIENLITAKEEDPINQYFIDNGYIELISSEYNSLLPCSVDEIYNEMSIQEESLINIIISILLDFILIPNIIPDEVYIQLFETITDLITRRDQEDVFAIHVEDILANVLIIIDKIDTSIFLKTGFIYQVFDIVNEENYITSHIYRSYFFLGYLIKEDSELVSEIISNIDIIEICCRNMEENNKQNQYLEGFFFYLTNLLHTQRNSIIESFYEINFFAWCLSISENLNYRTQKSICYFFLSVLFFASDDILNELLSYIDYIDYIFEILNAAKNKIIFHALNCFIHIYKVISHFSADYPFFNDQILIFLEKSNDFNDEINELFCVLQTNVDQCLV